MLWLIPMTVLRGGRFVRDERTSWVEYSLGDLGESLTEPPCRTSSAGIQ